MSDTMQNISHLADTSPEQIGFKGLVQGHIDKPLLVGSGIQTSYLMFTGTTPLAAGLPEALKVCIIQ